MNSWKNNIGTFLKLDNGQWDIEDILFGFSLDNSILSKIQYKIPSDLEMHVDEMVEAIFGNLEIIDNPKFSLDLYESTNHFDIQINLFPSIHELDLPKFIFSQAFRTKISDYLVDLFDPLVDVDNFYSERNFH